MLLRYLVVVVWLNSIWWCSGIGSLVMLGLFVFLMIVCSDSE